jgi:hypothetical protein
MIVEQAVTGRENRAASARRFNLVSEVDFGCKNI